MSDSTTKLSAQREIPACPLQLLDILGMLGAMRRDLQPDTPEMTQAEDLIHWAIVRVHKLTGISYCDLSATIARVSQGDLLDGYEPGGYAEEYCGPRIELSHVARPLHELDKDGATAQIWRYLYVNSSIVRTGYLVRLNSFVFATVLDPSAWKVYYVAAHSKVEGSGEQSK
jgi:hypothetical protein